MEFLKANGIEDHSFVKEMDYQVSLCKTFAFGKTKVTRLFVPSSRRC